MTAIDTHPGKQVYREVLKLMGNRFAFSAVQDDEWLAKSAIRNAIEEVRRIERLLTTFDDNSQTNRINRLAGIAPAEVDAEVIGLIERSIAISELTQGAFDITYGSVDKRFWNFDRTMTELPEPDKAREAVRLVNYRNIMIDKEAGTVFLKEKGMRIGFGGIGKGYAAERAKQVMLGSGISNGVVNAAGDLAAWGMQANGKPWTIGIANPDDTENLFSSLEISNKAVATSGNYEKFVLIGGKRYSHTIDPKTGYPVQGIKSVTIIAQHAELADALATPVTIMGAAAGIYLIDQLPGVECIIIDDHNRLFTSKNIKTDRHV